MNNLYEQVEEFLQRGHVQYDEVLQVYQGSCEDIIVQIFDDNHEPEVFALVITVTPYRVKVAPLESLELPYNTFEEYVKASIELE